jgi:hypothetical protein
MFPRGNCFLARLSVCITAGVSVGGWFFLFATELATEMGFTDDWFTDGESPSVLGSPTDFIAITDGINPSVKLDNVVVGGRSKICRCLTLLYIESRKIISCLSKIRRHGSGFEPDVFHIYSNV